MSGPFVGTFRKPFTRGRKASIKKGVNNARSATYGRLFIALLLGGFALGDRGNLACWRDCGTI